MTDFRLVCICQLWNGISVSIFLYVGNLMTLKLYSLVFCWMPKFKHFDDNTFFMPISLFYNFADCKYSPIFVNCQRTEQSVLNNICVSLVIFCGEHNDRWNFPFVIYAVSSRGIKLNTKTYFIDGDGFFPAVLITTLVFTTRLPSFCKLFFTTARIYVKYSFVNSRMFKTLIIVNTHK